uniref:Uncharacterized protein n=1 Tax=Oryza glumipatula TaxID=40148 RepID=A0A0E0BMC4_9ORYZ
MADDKRYTGGRSSTVDFQTGEILDMNVPVFRLRTGTY